MDSNADYMRLLLLEDGTSNVESFKTSANYVKEVQLLTLVDRNVIVNEIIPLVNAKVCGSNEERMKGLIILQNILPQCPSDILSDHCFSWMQQCSRWDGETVNEELIVMRVLIEYSSSFPDIKKQVVSTVLARFVDRLINHRSDKCRKVAKLKLKCLKSIIYHYNSSCGPYRSDFQKFVIFCLKQFPEQKKVIREAALCFVCLCQCASKGQHGANHKELWSSQLKALIDTCHKLFDSVFNCVDFAGIRPEVETEAAIPALLEIFKDVPVNPVTRFHGWKVTFSVLSKLVRYMFVSKYPVRKSFRPDDIFALVSRLLAVNGSTLKNCSQTNDIRCLNAILPDIHTLALEILLSLIRVAKRNLVSYGTLICKICLQTLKWTQPSEWKYATARPFQSLRRQAYVILSSWLLVAGSSSSIEIFADEIIPLTISNIEFLKPEVQLKPSTKQMKSKRKKHERNLTVNSHPRSYSSIVENRFSNKEICVAAHQMLQSMIRNAHSLIKWERHKTLQSTIIPLLTQIVGANSTFDYPLPYSNVECRLELFSTLYALTKWPHWRWKTPLSLASRIFNAGRNDAHFQVCSLCALAANELEATMHPRAPSLTATATSSLDVDDGTNDGQRHFGAAPESTLRIAATAGTCLRFAADATPSSTDALQTLPVSENGMKMGAGSTSSNPSTSVAAPIHAAAEFEVAASIAIDDSSRSENGRTAEVVDVVVTQPPVVARPSTPRTSDSETIRSKHSWEYQRQASSSPPHNSAPRKKSKIDNGVAQGAEHDAIITAMLNDFVDTIG